MLGSGERPSVVAHSLGVANETVSRWQQIPEFRSLVEKAHIKALKALIDDATSLIEKSHIAINGALSSDDISPAARENIALRYLSLSGATQNIYHTLDAKHAHLLATDEQSNRAFKWVIEVFDDLASLKAYNPQMSDAEYRQRAEALVRKTTSDNATS